MLDTTLASTFVPGTNRRGAAGEATWVYALPRLELGRVVCLLPPGSAVLRSLAGRAEEVLVLGSAPAGRRRRTVPAPANVRLVASVEPGTADLVVLAGRGAARRLAGEHAALRALLRPGG